MITHPLPSRRLYTSTAFLGSCVLAFIVVPGLQAADPRVGKTTTKVANPQLVRKAKGSLLLAGGGNMPESVRNRFVELAGGKSAHLVIIPTASPKADRPEPLPSFLMWTSTGVATVDVLHTRNRTKADDPDFLKPLKTATGVWVSGGDQSRLTEAYHSTAVEKELLQVLERGGVIGGTSAGASVMSELMITGGTTEATLSDGFGLVPGMVVDQHFANRKRFGRLLGVLAKHPDHVGLGIDEDTAVEFHADKLMVLGNANAWLYMPGTAQEQPSLQRLKAGDTVDVLKLTETFMAHLRGPALEKVEAPSAMSVPK